eukprot:gnl/Dysnectes_brevis/1083_a1211_3839.p1 GENE.gnl/Dysnectes_brevis/1083_a1211_3839~~gnl/Dysnectes_brevis/1083_a1211_3839.p1  ORF type:complete len:141 (+),score=10.56 gnl/Dysnectes_brevis/1083_a1211_3839:33-425(+)
MTESQDAANSSLFALEKELQNVLKVIEPFKAKYSSRSEMETLLTDPLDKAEWNVCIAYTIAAAHYVLLKRGGVGKSAKVDSVIKQVRQYMKKIKKARRARADAEKISEPTVATETDVPVEDAVTTDQPMD